MLRVVATIVILSVFVTFSDEAPTDIVPLRVLDVFVTWLDSVLYQVQPHLQFLRDYRNTQETMTRYRPFPCDIHEGRSDTPPKSVHRLRPGDIDVIASLGDSLTAGFGALTSSAFRFYIPSRSISFSIGGEDTWRRYLTLPNILKVYNPALKGYSVADSTFSSKEAVFNLARVLAGDDELVDQAKLLIKRMKADTSINFYKDWKLLTIFIGHNDLCGLYCYPESGNQTEKAHKGHLQKVLDYLQENLPRTYVNLVPLLDVNMTRSFHPLPVFCTAMHQVFCPCLHDLALQSKYEDTANMVHLYREKEKELVESGRYDTKDDFAVIYQPFTTTVKIMKKRTFLGKAETDFSYLSPDCFHLNQKGHAVGAIMLWKNMLQPEGNKSTVTDLKKIPIGPSSLKCPSKSAPYLFTRLNSETYLKTGKQDAIDIKL